MLSDYFPLLIFLAAVFVFGLIALYFPPWLAGHLHSAAKDLPYESGIVPRTGARRRFAVSFYLTAMLFIIFDVEAIFIYPWAVNVKGLFFTLQAVAQHMIARGQGGKIINTAS